MTLVAHVPNQVFFQNDVVVTAYVKQDTTWKRIWLHDVVDFYAEEGIQGNRDCRCTFMLYSASAHFVDMMVSTQIYLDWTRCGRYQGAFRLMARDRKRDANGMLIEGAAEFTFEPAINALADPVILHDLTTSATHWEYFGYPDDAIKECVRRQIVIGTAYDDPAGGTRGLDCWTVAANRSEHATSNADFDVRGKQLLPTIDGWAAKHSVDYFVRIGWNSDTGALAITFDTKVPRYGADRSQINTEGNDPVVLSDAMDSISALTCREDISPERNTYYDSVFEQVWQDTDRVTAYGLREAIVTGSGAKALAAMKMEIERNQYAKGADYQVRQTAAFRLGQTCEVGDRISHQATFFGMPVYHEMICQARYSYNRETGAETIEVTVGDPPPDQEDNSGSGSAWDLPMDQYWEPTIMPVAGENVIGDSLAIPYGNHQHQALLAVGATDVGPDDDGRWSFINNDGTLVLTPDAVAHEIDFAAIEGGSCLWVRDTTGDAFLRQKHQGDELRIKTSGGDDMFYVDKDGNIGGYDTGGSFLQALFRYYSFGDYATGVVGVHNINMAGDLCSDASGLGAGSQLRWTNTGDKGWFRDLYTIDGMMTGTTGWHVNEDGDTLWKDGAELTLESVVYRAPLSAPTDTDMVLGVASIGGSYKQLTWRDGIYGTPGTLTATTTNDGGADHTHAITAVSDTAGANSALLKSDASGFLTLEKLYITDTLSYFDGDKLQLGHADYYVEKSSGSTTIISGGGWGLDLAYQGAAKIRLQGDVLFPLTASTLDIGTSTYPIDDIHIDGYIYMDSNTDEKILMSDGIGFTPTVAQFSGYTDNFTTYGTVGYDGPIYEYGNSSNDVYFYMKHGTGGTPIWAKAAHAGQKHKHAVSGGDANVGLTHA